MISNNFFGERICMAAGYYPAARACYVIENMDKLYSDDYWLLQYRLKTARRRKRLVKEAYKKQLRELYVFRQNLWNEISRLGWEELHPPYQRGWKRTFVLRPEMARSKHAAFYETLLSKINVVQYSSRKDFKRKRRIKRKRMYVPVKQQLRELKEHELKKLSEREIIHFTKVDTYCCNRKSFETRYVLTEPNRFYQLRVMPNMITKVRRKNLGLESTLAEVELHIERNHLTPHICRLMHGNYLHWSWKMREKEKYKDPLRNMPVRQIMDEYYY